MLRIRIEEDDEEVWMTLQGSVAEPEVGELRRAWAELAPRLGGRQLSLDLRTVTHSDGAGVLALGEIYGRTKARLMTRTPWSEVLALEILYGQENGVPVEPCEWISN